MGKTIKIFLVDGEPNGLKTAELSNWVGKAIVIPRNKLKNIKNRPDCNKPAVYFLVGKENEEALLSTVYIGEAENLWDRLTTHDNSKDFWRTAIAFVSKDSNLTKAHVKYLESKCIEIAERAERFDLENTKKSSLPTLSEADVAEMEEFLNKLKLLLAAVGYPILQEITSKEHANVSDPLFVCKSKNASASGRMTNDGFVVYKDSTATTQLTKSVAKRNRKNLDKLISNDYLKQQDENLYVFIKDYVFNSPSAASSIILGRSSNGWQEWSTKDKKTLEAIYRK